MRGLFIYGLSALTAVIFVIPCHAKKEKKYPEQLLAEHYTADMIKKKVEEIKLIVTVGYGGNKDHPVYCGHLLRFSETFGFYETFAKTETLTGISKKWFGKVRQILEAMYPVKNEMDTALKNEEMDRYAEYKKEYDKLLDIFVKTIDKPERADPKTVREERKAEKEFIEQLDARLSPEGQLILLDESLRTKIRKLIDDETRKKREPLLAIQIQGFIRTIDYLIDNEKTEEATGNTLKWYSSLKEAATQMYKDKTLVERAMQANNKSAYSVAQSQYEESAKKFLDLVDKPVKVPEKGRKPPSPAEK
ncbi:MAG: hypothetical protein JW808_11170 [Victivallales bacterium]|nr:hypothetical protein [Victivallales bacterium]